MYNKNDEKQFEIDAMWEKYGNHNVENSTKSKALDEKYWSGMK